MKISDLNLDELEKRAAIDLNALRKAIGHALLGGSAVGLPAAVWYSRQPPADPEALDPHTGKPKVTNFDKWKGDIALHEALRRVHEDPDVKVDSGLHRVRIPKTRLKKDVLKYLNFVPTKIAVPERGQAQLTTYRQFDSAAHLHSHGDKWLMHQDRYPALNMAIRNPKNKGKMRKAIEGGLKHIGLEGIGGYIDWLGNVFKGGPTMAERAEAMRNPDKYPEIAAWLKKEEQKQLGELSKQGSAYEELKVRIKDKELAVEVADDDLKRMRGLSGREKLADDRGMLFSPGGAYWMKGCNFDLDVMFIDKEARVADVQTMRSSEPHKVHACRSEEEPVLAIEAPAGWCKRNGIEIGDAIS